MMNLFKKLTGKIKQVTGQDDQEICIYEESPRYKVALYDSFNQSKEKFYQEYQSDQQLSTINKKRRWNLDVTRIENNMKNLNPNEYTKNKSDFLNGSPIYNGDCSNFYGKDVKMKRVFYNKRKNII